MELVIKIDDIIYKDAVNSKRLFNEYVTDVAIAIMDGVPLDRHDEELIKDTVASIWGEPCEDAVSREAVINYICEGKECYKEDCKGKLYKRCIDLQWVYNLPSVTPQTDILDTIRAQIVDRAQRTMNDNRASGMWTCVNIIDKYRAESEE